jgi:hypothetical protein
MFLLHIFKKKLVKNANISSNSTLVYRSSCPSPLILVLRGKSRYLRLSLYGLISNFLFIMHVKVSAWSTKIGFCFVKSISMWFILVLYFLVANDDMSRLATWGIISYTSWWAHAQKLQWNLMCLLYFKPIPHQNTQTSVIGVPRCIHQPCRCVSWSFNNDSILESVMLHLVTCTLE